MPSSSNLTSKAFFALTALTLAISSGARSASAADSQADSRDAIYAIPSTEDFIRPSGANSDGLNARPGDFRYFKMDYGRTRPQNDSQKDDAEGKKPPVINQNATSSSGPIQPAQSATRDGRHSRVPIFDFSALNLTTEQKQKISELRQTSGKKARDLRAQLKTKREEIFNGLFDPDMTESALKEKHDDMHTLQEQMDNLMFDDLLATRAVLTADQKKRLAEIKPPPRPQGSQWSQTSQTGRQAQTQSQTQTNAPVSQGSPTPQGTQASPTPDNAKSFIGPQKPAAISEATTAKTNSAGKSDSGKTDSTKADTTIKPTTNQN